jgi:hypothetical protein
LNSCIAAPAPIASIRTAALAIRHRWNLATAAADRIRWNLFLRTVVHGDVSFFKQHNYRHRYPNQEGTNPCSFSIPMVISNMMEPTMTESIGS